MANTKPIIKTNDQKYQVISLNIIMKLKQISQYTPKRRSKSLNPIILIFFFLSFKCRYFKTVKIYTRLLYIFKRY